MTATLIHFTCPRCHRGLKVAAEAGGGHKPCPACGHMLEVPAVADEAGVHAQARGRHHPPPLPPPAGTPRFGAAHQAGGNGLVLGLTLGAALAAAVALGAYLLSRPTHRPSQETDTPVAAAKDSADSPPRRPAPATPSDRPDSASPRPAPTTPRDRPAPDRPAPAPESDEVLVPGEPALTREMAAQAIAFYEWALDIRMSQELRRTFRDDLVSEWKRADRAGRDKTAGTIQAMEKVRREDGPSERAQRRALVLQSLRKETDAVPRKLVELYEAKHGKKAVATLTVERLNATPEKFAGQTVVFEGCQMTGKLSPYTITLKINLRGRNVERRVFHLEVRSPAGHWYYPFGHDSGKVVFTASPELAGKLADEGLVAGRSYAVTLKGQVVKVGGYAMSVPWTVRLSEITFVDGNDKAIKTIKDD